MGIYLVPLLENRQFIGMNRIWAIVLSVVVAVAGLSPVTAADFTVINTSSSGAGSFSAILGLANASADPTVNIYFLSAVFDASRLSIPAPATPYIVSRPIIFHGPLSGVVLQQTTGITQRVLEIPNTAVGQTTFTDIVFSKGNGGAGGQLKIDAAGSAGTITVTFNHCDFLSATSTGRGGSTVVTGGGVVSFNRCSFVSNLSYSNGGAIAIANSTATFRTCFFADNTALDDGGGIFALNSTVDLFGCTVLNNTAGSHSYAQPASADDVGNGGGICSSSSTVSLVNTLLFGNSDVADDPLLFGDVHPDLSGAFVSSGHNFVGKRDGATGFGPTYVGSPPVGEQIGSIAAPLDPLLGYNDAPLWLSPVREAGSNSAASGFDFDVLGKARIIGKKVDIGALEFQYDRTVTNAADSGVGSLREALTAIGGAGAIGFDETFFSTPRTITLLSQLPQIVGPRIIDASFTQGVTVSGNSLYPIFHFIDATDGEYHALHSLNLRNGLKPVAGPIAGAAVDLPDEQDTLQMFNCTVSGCSGGIAIRSFANSKLVNCTISGNAAATSTSVAFYGKGDLIHCTVAGNSCLSGGPFAELFGNISLGNSIINANTIASGSAALTGISSLGGNVTDIAFALPDSSDYFGNARISSNLALDGGIVGTRALLLNSPAINNGETSLFFGYVSPENDANGRVRILDGFPDAGASEWTPINYTAWKPLVFTTTPGSEQGPQRDPDFDGVPNGVEFFCGTDPLVFNTNPLVFKYEGGVVTLQYPKAPGRVVQTVQLTSCSNLIDWAPLQAFPAPTLFSSVGFADIFQTIGSPGFNKRFFRLEVNP